MLMLHSFADTIVDIIQKMLFFSRNENRFLKSKLAFCVTKDFVKSHEVFF